MRIKVIPVGLYEVNSVLLWQKPEEAWLIDPGFDGQRILDLMRKEGVTPAIIVLTHAHFDHISAVNDILAVHPVPVYLHKSDIAMAFAPQNSMPPYPPTRRPATLVSDKMDGETLSCGGLNAKIIHTPGHTPGGWCLHFAEHKLLIAGDTLFAGSVGRTDFPGGSWAELQKSLKRLTCLPHETQVVCGHGATTTIGAEIESNPYLQA